MKKLETNLYFFQFYQEVDVKKVMEGYPWSFDGRALVMRHLEDGKNPHNIELRWSYGFRFTILKLVL